MSMAKAIFTDDFNYSSRKRNAGWAVKADPKPQSYPSELVDAAVEAGVATRVTTKRAAQKSGE